MSSSETFIVALFQGLADLLNSASIRPFIEIVVVFVAISMFMCLFRRK